MPSNELLHALDHVDDAARTVSIEPAPATSCAAQRAAVLLETTIHAPAGAVWDAISTFQQLNRWFGRVLPSEGTAGGYVIPGSAWGAVLARIPEQHLRMSWNFDDRTSIVDLDLTPPFDDSHGRGACDLSLSHSSELSDEDWQSFGVIGVGVAWDLTLLRLKQYLQQGIVEIEKGAFSRPAESVRAELDAWTQSREAHEFMRSCAARWATATLTAGTPAPVVDAQLRGCEEALFGHLEDPSGS